MKSVPFYFLAYLAKPLTKKSTVPSILTDNIEIINKLYINTVRKIYKI